MRKLSEWRLLRVHLRLVSINQSDPKPSVCVVVNAHALQAPLSSGFRRIRDLITIAAAV